MSERRSDVSNKFRAAFAVIAVALAATVFVDPNRYHQHILSLIAIWALFAVAWNLFSGLSGLTSFGHAIFFGIGSYTTAFLFYTYGMTPLAGVPLGAILACVAAVLVGSITFRLRGHYFALAMLAFPISLLYLVEWAGYQEIALPFVRQNGALYLQFAHPRSLTIVCFAALAAGAAMSLWVENTRFGLALNALRQNEPAAEASGLSSARLKMMALTLSAAWSAIAGGLYAVVILVVTPASAFGLSVSAQPLILSMFGGTGTAWGPMLGAAILVPLTEVLHAHLGELLPGIHGVILGAALIIVVYFMPKGVLSALRPPHPHSIVRSDANRADAPGPPLPSRLAESRCDPALELRGVSVRFGGLTAVDGVSLSASPGHILGVIGPNGAGKTTLFNVISGFAQPASGDVLLSGRPITGLAVSAICRMGVGRTFQSVRTFPEMTVLENVAIGAFAFTRTLDEARQLAELALSNIGLLGRSNAPVDQLTNHELRLVELARAVVAGPVLLLLDEPFAGLSAEEIGRFSEALVRYRDQGLAIVIIDHTVPALRTLVDWMVVLDHGAVISEGPPSRVLTHDAVISAYLGDGSHATEVAL